MSDIPHSPYSPLHRHKEPHSELSGFVRDAVIGMADGLTVPFAIAAGLANITDSTHAIVIAAMLSEIAAGSVSMGLGGYLAGRTETDQYKAERRREETEVEEKPAIEEQEVKDVLMTYGLSDQESSSVAVSLKTRKKDWVDFMMKFELGLEKPDPNQALKSAVTIGAGYVVSGMIPLAPYLIFESVGDGFKVSVIVTLIALAFFGFFRGRIIGVSPVRSMWQMVLVGSIAATAASLIAIAVA